MSDLEAFKIYLAVRLAFLENQPSIILEGKFPKKWEGYLPGRKDFGLIAHLIKISDGTRRGLLRLCVGNLLYGNKDFLYSETHTSRLMNSHLGYIKSIDQMLKKELDILQIRAYNFQNILEYYNSNKLLDDIYSRVVHMETLCLMYSANPEFIPRGGYLFDDIIRRIKIGSLFINLTDERKNLILNTFVK